MLEGMQRGTCDDAMSSGCTVVHLGHTSNFKEGHEALRYRLCFARNSCAARISISGHGCMIGFDLPASELQNRHHGANFHLLSRFLILLSAAVLLNMAQLKAALVVGNQVTHDGHLDIRMTHGETTQKGKTSSC